MPVVRPQRAISTNPLPGVRKSAAETPESLGGGAAATSAAQQRADVYGQLGALGTHAGLSAFAQIKADEVERADDTARLKWQNQFATFERDTLYDPEKGVLQKHGEDSFKAPEEVDNAWMQFSSGLEQGLVTDKQKLQFQHDRQEFGQSLAMTVRRHVSGEMQHFEGEQLQSRVSNATNAAVENALDPRRVSVELAAGEQAITTHAPRLGMSKDGVEKEIGAFRTAVHSGVIDRLLANEKDGAARAYFAETKDQINGESVARIEKALEEGGRRKRAQQQSDAIIAAGGTLSEQRAKARAIDDSGDRDAVMERIEHNAAIDERAKRDDEETRSKGVYNILDATHDVTKIPPTTWQQMTGSERASARSYAHVLAKGEPVETDLSTYYAMIQQASTNPSEFINQNLLNYKHKLDEGDFKQLAGLQSSIRNGQREKADKDLADFRTSSSVVDDALVGIGIDPNVKVEKEPEKAKAISSFRRMVDTAVATQQSISGKKATSQDVQSIVDDILGRTVTVKGSWLGLIPFTKTKISDAETPLINTTVADIPANRKAQIVEGLRVKGLQVSDALVLATYLDAVKHGDVK